MKLKDLDLFLDSCEKKGAKPNIKYLKEDLRSEIIREAKEKNSWLKVTKAGYLSRTRPFAT